VPGAFARDVHAHVFALSARTLRRKRLVNVLHPPHRRSQPDVEAMACQAVAELLTVQPEGPHDLVASCIGGVLAYEMARQLTEQGRPVGRLVLLDSVYPAREPGSELRQLARLLTPVRRLWRQGRVLKQQLQVRAGRRGSSRQDRLQQLELVRQMVPPRHSEEYVLQLARYRIRPWDGVVDYVVSDTLEPLHPEREWEPHVRALRLHHAPGDHDGYLGPSNAHVFRALLER
jgi:thioesterase domain-containing protein